MTSLVSTLDTPPIIFKETSRKIPFSELATTPGNIAIWLLVFAELSEFAFFFIVFLLGKVHNTEIFSTSPEQLNIVAGTLNTLVLISSSFFVAKAINAIKHNQRHHSLRWLWSTIVMGLIYCVIKYWEYQTNEAAGFDVTTNYFFATYYYLTFNHLVHVLMGICVILWITIAMHLGAYDKDNHEGMESAATYWHMIDLTWLLIFPLLYILK